MDVRKTIAQRLKSLREKAGFTTPDAFCEQHHFDFFLYHSYENATISMRASQLLTYSVALNTSLAYIVLGEDLKYPLKKQKITANKKSLSC